MRDNPLVSIITPCLNGETYIYRFFDSVLKQTYTNIELFFIADGSTDKTEEIAMSYKSALEKRGIKFVYICKENGGQAAAVNRGLELFSGVYLTWPDSDDWMANNCIEKKVEYLETHPDKGLVLCKTAVAFEENPDRIVSIMQRKNIANGWIFEDLICTNDIYFAPVGYMVRSDSFLKAVPNRKIYPSRRGQNWQMLLPVAYRYECGFINEVLSYYLVRENSRDREDKTYQDLIRKKYQEEDILDHVLDEIDMSTIERSRYKSIVKISFSRKRMILSAKYHKQEDLKSEYSSLKNLNALRFNDNLIYLYGRYRVLSCCYEIIKFPIRIIRKLNRMMRMIFNHRR